MAHRSLEAAEGLYRDGYHDFAASRAYYGMFYAAEAALASKGLSFSRHAGVIGGFSHHFVKTGVFPPGMHRGLVDAWEIRAAADYRFDRRVSPQVARDTLDKAHQFVVAVHEYLESEC